MGNKLDNNDRYDGGSMENRPLRPLKSSPIPPPIIPSSTPKLSYAASNTLGKKLVLPDRERWRVPVEDVFLDGQLVINVKTKSLLWECYSNVKTRPLTLTRRGFLVIYMKGNKGYIIDVCAAKSIECVTDKRGEKNSYYRTHIKLRYSFGNVHLWGFYQNGLDWKLAIQKAFERSIPPYRSPITSTSKCIILPPPLPQPNNAITSHGNDEKNEETEMLSAAESLTRADVVKSEYLAPELRPIAQTESAVTWMSLTDVINEQEEAKQESPHKKMTTDFQDTNIPSITHMQRVRQFLCKSLPAVDRSFSAPHIMVEEKPIKPQSPKKPADLLNASVNEENEQESLIPKQNVAEICAKLEKTLSTRQPSYEKKGFNRWIKKATLNPEKKAQSKMKESMISTVGYKKTLGWGKLMVGTNSETNV